MKYTIQNKEYNVEIVHKNNKNTYIRIKEDETIYVTTAYFTTKNQIKRLLDNNIESITKMLDKNKKKQEKNEMFYYLGNPYYVIYMPSDFEINDNKIYVKDEKTLNKWLKKEILKIYTERLNYWYNIFEENIPYPKLKIRMMKTRWGVCNRRDNSVTLNSELIKYDLTKLDYVIVHELSHFIHFNHSKSFWNLVEKYSPNYKKIRKDLKE